MSARVSSIALLRRAIAPLLLCAIGALPASAQSAGVAMVTDLKGKATALSMGRSHDLTILDELEASSVVQLSPGATLVVLYLDAGDEYVFKGPATIEFRPGQPEMESGVTPERRSLAAGKSGAVLRIKPIGMTQGGLVFRRVRADGEIQLLSLRSTRTLETQPQFHWKELQPGLKYGFALSDETGRKIVEVQVNATSIKLPGNVQLKEGVPYTWEVTTRLPSGKKYSSSAEFAVAPADLRAQAEALRPAASAPLSTRIAYAVWLDQAELRDEARKYWKTTSAERPENSRLRALAAQ